MEKITHVNCILSDDVTIMTSSLRKVVCMFGIKFPTKCIFRIFPILRTDGMVPFGTYLWNDHRIMLIWRQRRGYVVLVTGTIYLFIFTMKKSIIFLHCVADRRGYAYLIINLVRIRNSPMFSLLWTENRIECSVNVIFIFIRL